MAAKRILPSNKDLQVAHELAMEVHRAEQREGWFFRFCKHKTEADEVRLFVGKGGDEGSHRLWIIWKPELSSEFDFPADLRQADEVWVKGQASPDRKNVYFCIGFRDHIVKHFDFDSADPGEEHEKHTDDTDDCAC